MCKFLRGFAFSRTRMECTKQSIIGTHYGHDRQLFLKQYEIRTVYSTGHNLLNQLVLAEFGTKASPQQFK